MRFKTTGMFNSSSSSKDFQVQIYKGEDFSV